MRQSAGGSISRVALIMLPAIVSGLCPPIASALPTWGYDPAFTGVNIDAQTFADNGANGFRAAGIWDEDTASATLFTPNFVIGPDTFDLGASANPISVDDFPGPPPFSTSASAVGVVTVDGLGTDTLEVRWRVNTLNDTFAGDGFNTFSLVQLTSGIDALINGVAPGTQVKIRYDWEYFASAVPDYEALLDDPVSATGFGSFLDDQLLGPGAVINVAVGEPGPFTGSASNSGSYFLTTGALPTRVTFVLGGRSDATMKSPGDGPNQEDLAGSEFIGRITLRLEIPEPSSLTLAILAASGLGVRRRIPRSGRQLMGEFGQDV